MAWQSSSRLRSWVASMNGDAATRWAETSGQKDLFDAVA
jgi:hypothetical protein